jgi:signal transduction histidine kinase
MSCVPLMKLCDSDVLDFSKLQEPNAQSKARSEAINIRELAQGIAKGCSTPHFRRASADAMMNMGGAMPNSEQSQAGGSPKVEVLLDVCNNIPEIVWGDKVYLTRVVMNLIK